MISSICLSDLPSMNNEYLLSKLIMIPNIISNTVNKWYTIISFINSITYNNQLFYLFLIYTRLASLGETSIHSILIIQILVIDLNSTYSNDWDSLTVWRLGISIHHSIIQYQTRKSNWTRFIETISFRSDGS